MLIYRFFILVFLLISVYGIVEQEYNETPVNFRAKYQYKLVQNDQALQQFAFPTFKIPDLLNPDKSGSDNSASIPKQIPRENLMNIGLPTLPRLLPTAFPIKLTTIKLPTLPHLLPTALPKIPTIKLPTFPHILPTALPKIPTIKIPTFPHILPTLFPPKPKPTKAFEGITPNTPYTLPYPLPSDVVPIPFLNNNSNPGDNLVCNICESAVTIVKTKLLTVEKAVRGRLSELLGGLCDILMKNPATMFLGPPCTMFKANIIDKIFQKLDNFENSIDPKGFCKHVPFCK